MLRSQMKWNFKYENKETFNKKQGEQSIVDQLLHNRGLIESDEIERFLNPKLEHLHDPALLNGLEESKKRIDQAIEAGESILVFGDYDADGVSATTLLVETLNELGAMCDYYIPNRFTEGYGPNEQAFREAKEHGFDLIITVDTGIAAFEPLEVAKEIGLDVIVTDHHEIQEKLPVAYAIVHPKQSENYPFKELAGVGVAFKLAQYLLGYFPEQFLDLVVIGTVADLVPLIDENRILVKFGLEALTKSNRPGLVALKETAAIKGDVDEQDIGFGIGPRLNAAGRLESAYPAVELLLTQDPEEAGRLASEIDVINQERQQIVNDIYEEAKELVDLNKEENRSVIVVAKEGWNEGVLGIVASKLVRSFDRPAICLALKPDEKKAKGSGRSITAFDLFENGMEINDLFLQFGGHSQAVGMTLAMHRVDDMRNSLNRLADEKLQPEDYKEQLDIEMTIDIGSIQLDMLEEIEKLAPFGMANPKPLFFLTGSPTNIKQIGAKKNHLKFLLEQDGKKLAAVGFGIGDRMHLMTPNDHVELVGDLQINEWNGNRTPQLLIKDLRINETQIFDYRGSNFWLRNVQHVKETDYLCVSFQGLDQIDDFEITAFDQIDQLETNQVTDLILIDMPNQLAELVDLLSKIKPDNIYLCYLPDQDKEWSSFPIRDDFKWFYAFLMQQGKYDHDRQKKQVANHKGWKINKIEFIINVFYELKFVKIEEGIVILNDQVKKRELQESTYYQKGLAKKEIQDVLYYSSYKDIKLWLKDQMQLTEVLEEEKVDGL